jgi:diguanylate cyclase (GGDEF)-like protein/PAS domain S-box-containing protein
MEIEFRMRTHTGAFLWLAIKGRVVEWDQNGQALRMSGTQVDISHKKEQQNQLRLAASVFTNAHEGILITKTDGTIVDCNDAFHRITGYARDEVIGRDPSVLKSGRQSNAFYKNMWQSLQVHGYWAGEVWNRRKNGEVYAEFLTISAVRNQRNEIENYVGIFSDITTTKMHQKELEHLAHYDVLTGLPNRTLLADRLQTAMARAQSTNSMLAVAFLDLDGFKAVNDTYGHERGDDLLREISKRMNAMLHKNDTLARLGGDEFVVLLSNLQDPEDCTPALQDLLAAASAPVFVNDLELTVSASIGVCFYPSHDDIDADQLLRQADQAMYQAKLSGKNRYFVFDPAQDEAVKGHHENLDQIQKALAHQEFILHFQPKVNLRTGHTIGAEALIRWQHPERGLLSPAMFIPTIENHPLSISLGEWVIDAALQQLTDWKALGLNFPISVNITALHLQQNDFANHIHDALGRYPKVPPHQLEIEILETGALQDMERALRNMQACIDLGVRFSIDDFGTGYSSLVYLKKLPISVIKIDQSFIRDILYDCDDLTITNGIIGLAKAYGLPCIAEGVETEIHCEHMLRLGCELVQGYGVARPMSADGFLEWHQTWAPHPAWAHIKSATGLTLLALFAETELRNSMSNSHIMSLHDATQAANVQSIAKWMNGFAMAHPYAAQEQPFILLKSAYDTFQDLSTLTHLPEAQEQVEYQHLCQKMIDLVRQLSERHGDDIKDLVLSP